MVRALDDGSAYEELDELYDVWCTEVVEDIPFYVGLAGALAGALGRDRLEVLELGGGSGRVALPLAAAGHAVTAVDLSGRQLARLEQRASETGVAERVTAIRADMRELEVAPASFDLVLAPFRCMLHVAADRTDVLGAVARAVRPGGAFAFDVFHPDAAQIASTDGRWIRRRTEPTASGRWRFDERARYSGVAGWPAAPLGMEVDVRCRWGAKLMRSRRDAPELLPDPEPGDPHERRTTLRLTLLSGDAWRRSLADAGLELDGAYGWFDGRPLVPGDDDLVWVARRPAAD